MSNGIVAIVQARLGSSRLPNKMMYWLHGKSIVEWSYRRLKSSCLVNRIIYAIPTTKENDLLENHLKLIGADVVRGSESDVLGRYLMACKYSNPDVVVRVCADNPFVTATEVDAAIQCFLDSDYDYVYNHIPLQNTYPDGLGAEVVSSEMITYLANTAKIASHREHIFNYISDNISEFRAHTFSPADQRLSHPNLKFDINTIDDYLRLLKLPVKLDSTALEIVDLALRFLNS